MGHQLENIYIGRELMVTIESSFEDFLTEIIDYRSAEKPISSFHSIFTESLGNNKISLEIWLEKSKYERYPPPVRYAWKDCSNGVTLFNFHDLKLSDQHGGMVEGDLFKNFVCKSFTNANITCSTLLDKEKHRLSNHGEAQRHRRVLAKKMLLSTSTMIFWPCMLTKMDILIKDLRGPMLLT